MIKIIRLFILSLALLACGDSKEGAADSLIKPENKVAKDSDWPHEFISNLHDNCLEGLLDEVCLCLIEAITSNMTYSIYKSINIKDSAGVELSPEEKKISNSVDLKWNDCLK